MQLLNRKILLVSTLVIAVLAVSIGFSFQKVDEKIKNQKPNFIFYLADDQDQLDYGVYGNSKVQTGAIDKLASEGMRFTNAYTAQSICAPSRSQIYTGLQPIRNGCYANHIPVKKDVKSITKYLREQGYEVILVGKSHVKPNTVFDWDVYYPPTKQKLLPLDKVAKYFENANKPFCMILASDFPHGPYPKTEKYTLEDIKKHPYTGKFNMSKKPGYYQNIENDNDQLTAVLSLVEKYRLKDNSLFMYASDHGIDGKWSIKEPGLKIPLVVRWPNHVEPNSVNSSMISLVDILPTFLDIAQVPETSNFDGNSFLEQLKGSNEDNHQYIYGVATRQNVQKAKIFPSRSIRNKQFKYIKNFNSLEVYKENFGDNDAINSFIEMGAKSFKHIPYEELYDLANDPYEKNNLAKNLKYQDTLNNLSEALEQWMISQKDFLIANKMPLLKPTLHPLDESSKWKEVPQKLQNSLSDKDYIPAHY